MSTEVISQKVKKTCDGCGSVHEYELIGFEENQSLVEELQNWYTVVREIWTGRGWAKIAVQACSLACVPAAAVKLAAPPPVQEESPIDLGALQVGRTEIN